MLIVGYHVAKTGGTTVMHHIRNHLGDAAYFGYGQHPALKRFFKLEPLWEEMTETDRAPVRFVFGHQVPDRLLAGLGGADVGLFTVIRDPYTHFVSQYKYHLSILRGQGQHESARDYFKRWEIDRAGGELYKYFTQLLPDPEADYSRDGVFHILRQFRFLCATERLTEQSAPLCRELGIPPIEGRYRVSSGQVDLEGITPDDVYQRCPIDREIHETLMAGDKAGNALAYDDAAFRASLDRLQESYDREVAVTKAYRRLASFFRAQDLLEAAQLFLSLKGAHHPKYRSILRLSPEPGRMRMKLAVARSEKEKGEVYARFGYPSLACACLEKAIALNENYVDAYVSYAHVLRLQGQEKRALEAVRHARSLDPESYGVRQFLGLLEE